jgi:hypothetical protein
MLFSQHVMIPHNIEGIVTMINAYTNQHITWSCYTPHVVTMQALVATK